MDVIGDRKDLILMLLHARGRTGPNEPVNGITRMEKLLFLARDEDRVKTWVKQFKFMPDNFGPFSYLVQDDLEELRTLQLVEFGQGDEARQADEYVAGSRSDIVATPRPIRYSLTPTGAAIAAEIARDAPEELALLTAIKEKFNSISLDRLLEYVYKNSEPVWTSKSIIAGRYLGLAH